MTMSNPRNDHKQSSPIYQHNTWPPIVPLDQVQDLGLFKVPCIWMIMCQVADFVSQIVGNKDLSSANPKTILGLQVLLFFQFSQLRLCGICLLYSYS